MNRAPVTPAAVRARRMKLLRFIIEFKAARDGNGPTTREIMDYLGVRSTSIVRYMLYALERDGHIRLLRAENGRGLVRGIAVRGATWSLAPGVAGACARCGTALVLTNARLACGGCGRLEADCTCNPA